jgi:hypothetical protein
VTKSPWPLKRLVEVEWRDACTHSAWEDANVHREKARDIERKLLRSVGYLVRCNRRSVTIAQSMSSMTQYVSDSITIPRGEVRSIRQLGRVK